MEAASGTFLKWLVFKVLTDIIKGCRQLSVDNTEATLSEGAKKCMKFDDVYIASYAEQPNGEVYIIILSFNDAGEINEDFSSSHDFVFLSHPEFLRKIFPFAENKNL